MDAKRRENGRRRCCVCGRKFQPKPSARKHQETCGAECRSAHEAALARERYRANPVKSRQSSRERKRRWREGKAAPARRRLPAEVVEAVAQEAERLGEEATHARERLQQVLLRVARRACASAMSLGGLGADSAEHPRR